LRPASTRQGAGSFSRRTRLRGIASAGRRQGGAAAQHSGELRGASKHRGGGLEARRRAGASPGARPWRTTNEGWTPTLLSEKLRQETRVSGHPSLTPASGSGRGWGRHQSSVGIRPDTASARSTQLTAGGFARRYCTRGRHSTAAARTASTRGRAAGGPGAGELGARCDGMGPGKEAGSMGQVAPVTDLGRSNVAARGWRHGLDGDKT